MERTLILVKPDAFARNLTGEIIARFERKGLRLVALKLTTMSQELAAQHYAEHEGKPFYDELVSFITSAPLVAMVLEGEAGDRGGASGDRSDEPAAGDHRVDPRRLRDRGRTEHGPRFGCDRVGGPRGGAVLPTSGLILASRSPQRRAILEQLGIEFSVAVPAVEELEAGPPTEVVLENAYRKASAVAAKSGEALVLGVDTIVCLGSQIFGKPPDVAGAREVLLALAGRRHLVISGLCLVDDGVARTAAATTFVEFRSFDEPLLEWYLASEEWRERAGGYAIQGRGAALVERIEGDYLNVVGLPVSTLLELAPGLIV